MIRKEKQPVEIRLEEDMSETSEEMTLRAKCEPQRDPLAGDWTKLIEEARLGNESYEAQERNGMARIRYMEQGEEIRLNND